MEINYRFASLFLQSSAVDSLYVGTRLQLLIKISETKYLLALSSNVRSIHCVEAVINGSCIKHIKWRASAQQRSLLMGFLLYGIALEP